ncbi:PAS sensor protein, partial [Actinospica acidiphila]
MANVVGEGAAGRSTRTLRAEGALSALAADPHATDRLRRVLEQALVFAGAAFAGFYTLGEDRELLCLAETAGVPRTLCGVRDCYSATGRSPVAEAHRGHTVWLGPRDLAAQSQSRRTP